MLAALKNNDVVDFNPNPATTAFLILNLNRNDRDVYKDVSWDWGIHGYKSRLISVRDGAEVPCCFDVCW